MERDDAINKVMAMWKLADHPNTPENERVAAVEFANKLMAKYQIDQLTINEASDTREAVIMFDLRLTERGRATLVKAQRIALAHQIAIANRCRAIIYDKDDSADVDTGKRIPGGEFMALMGYESDVQMVRSLYSSLGYALVEALTAESVQTTNYQENFATGFVDRIRTRLNEINRTVHKMAEESGGSMALVLRDRSEAVEDFMSKRFPHITTYKVSSKTKFDPNAQERGARAANAVDVGATRIGGDSRGQLPK